MIWEGGGEWLVDFEQWLMFLQVVLTITVTARYSAYRGRGRRASGRAAVVDGRCYGGGEHAHMHHHLLQLLRPHRRRRRRRLRPSTINARWPRICRSGERATGARARNRRAAERYNMTGARVLHTAVSTVVMRYLLCDVATVYTLKPDTYVSPRRRLRREMETETETAAAAAERKCTRQRTGRE